MKHFTLDDLLKRDKQVSIQQKNPQLPATEIYKTKNDLGPNIMKDTFHFIQKPYNLRNNPELQRQKPESVLRNRKYVFACPQNMGINTKRH